MTECPTDGVCAFCALAFSTLLSSQGADAHLWRALTLLQGNYPNLPGKVPFVNPVRENFANSWTCPASRVASAGDLHAQREALARRTSWWLPGTWRFHVHPLGARRTLGVLRAFVKSNAATRRKPSSDTM